VLVGVTAGGAEHAVAATGAPEVSFPTIQVDASNPDGADSLDLVAGQAYQFSVGGTYTPGAATEADAECSATSADPTFVHDRYVESFGSDMFSLQVDRQSVSWAPLTADNAPGDTACNSSSNSSSHRYTLFYIAPSTGPVNFRVLDTFYGDNAGSLIVTVSIYTGPTPSGTLVDDFVVPANAASGVDSTVVATAADRYRVRASGVFSTSSGSTADPACTQSAVGIGRRPGLNGSNSPVVVNRGTTNWSSTEGLAAGCSDTDHAYTVDLRTGSTGPINVAVADSWYPDNTGLVHVQIFRNPPASSTSAMSSGLIVDTVQVDSAQPNGASSRPLVAGQAYIFTVSGTFTPGLGTAADAECTATETPPRFVHDRYATTGADMFALYVDGHDARWSPVAPDAVPKDPACDSTNHRYTLAYTPQAPQPVNFKVLDTYYGDNSGSLTVTISVLNPPSPPSTPPADDFYVSAADANGATSGLTMASANRYQVRISGVFSTSPGASADAACSQSSLGVGIRPGVNGTGAPAVINHGPTNWAATQGLPPGCNDTDHTYSVDLPGGSTGPINVAVNDTWFADNSGVLHVQIFVIS
jgi:hypothetical protein